MDPLMQSYQRKAQAPLADAEALPFAVYHDPAVYRAEIDSIFHRDWVFVCAEQQLKASGDYLALTIAGESVVILRGKDGQVRALSNNCRHRGTPLLEEGFGRLDGKIVCPYHAWTYKEDGGFVGAPMPGEAKIDKGDHCLRQFSLERWLGLLFINFSDNPKPLADRLAGIDPYLQIFEPVRFTEGHRGEWESWQCNWKLAVENGIESYHLFKVHQNTLETLAPTKKAYYVAGHAEWLVTGGEYADQPAKWQQWLMGKYPEAFNHYLLICLPPSFVAILSYDSLSWLQILPDGPEGCRITSGAIAETAQGTTPINGPMEEAFIAEDKEICERVQRGMHSRHGTGGRLVTMEKPVVDFHQYLASRLFDSPIEPCEVHEKAKIFTNGS